MALFLGPRNLEEKFLWIVRIDNGITRKPKSSPTQVILCSISFIDMHGTDSIRTLHQGHKLTF